MWQKAISAVNGGGGNIFQQEYTTYTSGQEIDLGFVPTMVDVLFHPTGAGKFSLCSVNVKAGTMKFYYTYNNVQQVVDLPTTNYNSGAIEITVNGSKISVTSTAGYLAGGFLGINAA